MMDREAIDEVICQIMILDGPDRHVDGPEIIGEFTVWTPGSLRLVRRATSPPSVDGHEILSDFALALQEGRANEWLAAHQRYYLDAR